MTCILTMTGSEHFSAMNVSERWNSKLPGEIRSPVQNEFRSNFYLYAISLDRVFSNWQFHVR